MKDNDKYSVGEALSFTNVEIPLPTEGKMRGKEYVTYGIDNKYPLYLQSLYNDCAEHQTIIDGVVQYIIGQGINTTNAALQKFFTKINSDDETIIDLLSKIVLDYLIYGGFSVQPLENKVGKLGELYWVDNANIRLSEDEKFIFYSKKWGTWGAEADKFINFSNKNTKKSIYYFKGNKTRGIYPQPLYNAAIKSIQTLVEINKFHLNNVANGFAASTLFSFNNGVPDDTTKRNIEEKLSKKFMNTSGQKFITIYNESKETGVEITKMDADNFGEQFDTLYKTAQNTVFTSHRITSPALFGIKMENTGFSETEYNEAFTIFNSTIIKSYQNTIISELNKLFKPYFGNDLGITIKPYQLKSVENGNI